jgi:type VI secretion system protein ImpK
LIRDSEDEFGGIAGDDADHSAVPTDSSRREAPSYHPRPFTAWPTARDKAADESLWARARNRVARWFGRGAHGNNGHGPETDAESVIPPQDFQFPWTRPDEAPAAGSEPDPATRSDEYSTNLPLLAPFETVEEALPAPILQPSLGELESAPLGPIAEADTDPMLEPATVPTETHEVPRAPGFFARLFGRSEETTQDEQLSRPSDEINSAFLVAKFRAFYNEILHQKHQGTAMSAGFATAIVTQDETLGESPEQAAQALSARLQQMLELQQAEATWMGGESAARYHDAQYAMTVLADETLASIEWKGRPAWRQFSLEQKLFKSSAADLEFFKRVDRLFKEGAPTTASRDLARVYLQTIAAGFRGKYGAFGLTRALHEYRQRLFEYIHGGDALMLYAEDRVIFPEAVSHTIVGRATARVSGAQRWIVVLAVVLMGYTVLAHLAWNRASSELRDVTARVEATNRQGAR